MGRKPEKTTAVGFSLVDKLAKINQAIKEIECPSGDAKTNGKITMQGKVIELNSITSEMKLIEIASYINSKEAAYNMTADKLKLGTYPVLKISGYGAKSWAADIKDRIMLSRSEEKLGKLKAAAKELESLMSDEERITNVWSDIEELLG